MSSERDSTRQVLHERFLAFWANPPGWRVASAVNHSSVGSRYIVTGLVFFLLGGLLAMAMRAQLAWSGLEELDHDLYNQFVTMHGTTMMFLFAVPIMEGLGLYLIPKMIGARDLPFPRLGAFGYWCYLFGGIFLYSSFLFGAAPDGGWFMYVPLNAEPYSPGLNADFWLLGVTFIEISAVAAAVELIVAILKTRAPGMSIARMPLFAWYILVMAFMIIFGFPPLIMASIMLELERNFGFVFFDVNLGGDPLLWQHLFWIFGHPEVYIIFLPAAGIVTMVVETFARRPLIGYTWVVIAIVGTGFISFALWVHHMYTTGLPRLSLNFFSAASMAVAIPSGIQVFAWIATLWHGRPVVTVPMLYVLGFLFTFVLGGLTGVMVALVPFDWQVHDTHFVVAHMHYVLFGGMVFPLFAGLYYWLPLFSGRTYSDRMGRVGFWTVFAGFHITFLPMHLTGMLGMTRRIYTYQEGLGWEWLNLISTVGSFVAAAGVAIILVDLVMHFRFGSERERNPWQAGTLEWSMQAPVPPYNIISIPTVTGRHPLWEQPELVTQMEQGRGLLADPGSGERETLGTSVTGAVPESVIRLPRSSWHPFWGALGGVLFLIGILVELYWLSLLGTLAVIVVMLRWAWESPYRTAPVRIDVGGGLRLPNQSTTLHAPGLWGLGHTLIAVGATYAALLYAYFYLWTVSDVWPPVGQAVPGLGLPALAAALLAVSSGLAHWAERANRRGKSKFYRGALVLLLLIGAGYFLLTLLYLDRAYPGIGDHAYLSVVNMIHGFQLFMLGLAMLVVGFAIARSWHGYIDQAHPMEAAVTGMLWHFAVLLGLLAFVVVALSPYLI